jgi:hypothetical protein
MRRQRTRRFSSGPDWENSRPQAGDSRRRSFAQTVAARELLRVQPRSRLPHPTGAGILGCRRQSAPTQPKRLRGQGQSRPACAVEATDAPLSPICRHFRQGAGCSDGGREQDRPADVAQAFLQPFQRQLLAANTWKNWLFGTPRALEELASPSTEIAHEVAQIAHRPNRPSP